MNKFGCLCLFLCFLAACETNLPKPGIEAGSVFQDPLADGGAGPKMVWIPAGEFRMETGTGQTQRKVWVDGFAMGAYEVTFAEYDRFAEATHREKTDDSGYGRGNRPVINITWEDAVAYTEWLSEQTERRYRLPAEAEWEYAARAGTQTKYWWGNDIGVNRAACSSCGSQWDDKQTAPAGSFAANSFGLYDTAGNVWEWTCSEYEEKASSENCSARAGDEGLRAVRGGAWDSLPQWACASCRYGLNPTYRYLILGFRVAAVR